MYELAADGVLLGQQWGGGNPIEAGILETLSNIRPNDKERIYSKGSRVICEQAAERAEF